MTDAQRVALRRRAKREAERRVHVARDAVAGLSHRIHAHPETGYEEERASAWVADALAAAGLSVTLGTCGLPTAIRAVVGAGPVTLAVCAEYDALPGIGHACGHNMIAAAAVATGVALAPLADDLGLTLLVLGTPAEEMSGGGKIRMLEGGAFDCVDAAMMIHPAPFEVAAPPLIASEGMLVEYCQEAAPAGAWPHASRDADDAMVVAQAAIGLLRQQLPASCRVHGVVAGATGALGVAQRRASGRFAVRAPTSAEVDALRDRLACCFAAGGLATGCEVDMRAPAPRYLDVRHDPTLAGLYRDNATRLGRTFEDGATELARFTPSTDMGNVSHRVPTIHPYVRVGAWPVVNHQPEFAAQCVTPAADDAMLAGAVAMAWTAIDIGCSPGVAVAPRPAPPR